MGKPFSSPAAAALAILTAHASGALRMTRKAGAFTGQVCVDPTPLTPAQAEWLRNLLDKAGLPSLADGGEQ